MRVTYVIYTLGGSNSIHKMHEVMKIAHKILQCQCMNGCMQI